MERGLKKVQAHKLIDETQGHSHERGEHTLHRLTRCRGVDPLCESASRLSKQGRFRSPHPNLPRSQSTILGVYHLHCTHPADFNHNAHIQEQPINTDREGAEPTRTDGGRNPQEKFRGGEHGLGSRFTDGEKLVGVKPGGRFEVGDGRVFLRGEGSYRRQEHKHISTNQ